MTVAKGQPWGELGPLPEDGVVVADDAAVAAVITEARSAGTEVPPIGLLGGDLCRTVGGRGSAARLRSPDAARLVVDLLVVRLDGGPEHVAVAHVIARRATWLFGPIVAVMNAAWLGSWNVAPRAHPNDGVADLVRADPSIGDRWKARSRLPLGTHVPHPSISMTRAATFDVDLGRPTTVWLDGIRRGRARRIEGRVEPDAVRITV